MITECNENTLNKTSIAKYNRNKLSKTIMIAGYNKNKLSKTIVIAGYNKNKLSKPSFRDIFVLKSFIFSDYSVQK